MISPEPLETDARPPAREPDAGDPPGASGPSRSAELTWTDIAARWIVGLALYVTSIGPMYWHWYAAKWINGPKWIAVLYEPLYLASNFKPVGRWLNWYIRLWIE